MSNCSYYATTRGPDSWETDMITVLLWVLGIIAVLGFVVTMFGVIVINLRQDAQRKIWPGVIVAIIGIAMMIGGIGAMVMIHYLFHPGLSYWSALLIQ